MCICYIIYWIFISMIDYVFQGVSVCMWKVMLGLEILSVTLLIEYFVHDLTEGTI